MVSRSSVREAVEAALRNARHEASGTREGGLGEAVEARGGQHEMASSHGSSGFPILSSFGEDLLGESARNSPFSMVTVCMTISFLHVSTTSDASAVPKRFKSVSTPQTAKKLPKMSV